MNESESVNPDSVEPELIICPNCKKSVEQGMLIPAGDTQVCPLCRDSYLQSLREGTVAGPDSSKYEAIRNAHLTHEASIKSVGILYYLGGGLAVLGGLGSSFGLMAAEGSELSMILIMAMIFLALGILYLFLGSWLRALDPRAKVPAAILSGLGLLSFPVGTLINGYILYLLLSKKGSVVLSHEYREIVAATPHIKYKTSLLTWIFLAIIIIAFVGIIGVAVS